MRNKKVNNYQLSLKLFVLALTFNFLLITFNSFSQVGVGINTAGTAANTSAILDVSSTTQGQLFPRMTTAQRNAIASPVESLLIYNTTTQCYEGYNASTLMWVAFGCIGCQLPGVFSASAASNVAATSFDANWTASTGATTYYIDVNSNSTFTGTWILNNQNAGSGTTYSVTSGLTCNTPYYYRVRANNTCGTSANSNTITVTTSACGCAIACVGPGTITTIAGNGIYGLAVDGLQAACTPLAYPQGVALDASGNIYIADMNANKIRKVNTSGIITTFAGVGGAPGYSGDGGQATNAQLWGAFGVALDNSGNVYFSDRNNVVRKITVSTGIISNIAGIGGAGGYNGDGIAATSAQLNNLGGIALDGSGNVYIADASNNRVRKVTVSSGIISTIAGTGTGGFSGDGGNAASAKLNSPSAVVLDGSGNVYITDMYNQRIRKITGTTINTIAGNGTAGYTGDGGPATNAEMNYPYGGIALDASGNVYFTDYTNNVCRKITVATGFISTFAGNGTGGYSGDGGAATSAKLLLNAQNAGSGVAIDGSGNVFISDNGNSVIRKVCK